ncbi:sugar ABC transporter substrate-binding protein [Nocardioides endophyticus]|uniref:Sugar ABC transporter substrate-binding protein n=1 Tax=Nocardioides endophyticus TaxID=1353775 RepID=A0ABP8ZAX6_9ACTN
MQNKIEISRRGLLAITAGIGVAATLSGCGGGSGASATTMTFLNEETDPPILKFIQGAVKRYESETGVRVSLSQKAIGDLTQLLSSVQAGDAFDMSTASYTDVTYLGPENLSQLDGLMNDAAGGIDNFMESALILDDGHYYGFPYNINNIAMYYRTDRLEQVGAEVPSTWDELKDLLSKMGAAGLPGITQPISAKGATSDVGAELLWSNEVTLFDDESNVILDDSAMMSRTVDCLEFLKEIQPYFVEGMESVDYGDIVKGFITGTSSIAPYSGRIVDTIESDASDLADKFAFEAFPTPEAGMTPATGYDVNYWLIPKNSDGADQALDFLAWFVKNEFVDYLLTGPFNMQPPLKSIYQDKKWSGAPVFKKYPEVRKTLDKMAVGDGYRAGGLWIQPPVDGVIKERIFSENVIPNMFQGVLLGGDSPTAAVQKAADNLRKIASS